MTAPLATSLLFFASHNAFSLHGGFSYHTDTSLAPVFAFPGSLTSLCPYSSDYMQYRNLNLLSIDYVFRPCLRPRLTQSRSALLWNPWVFGREDSHLTLATHSGILSSYFSTASSDTASTLVRMLLYQVFLLPKLRCCVLAPDIFGAGPLD